MGSILKRRIQNFTALRWLWSLCSRVPTFRRQSPRSPVAPRTRLLLIQIETLWVQGSGFRELLLIQIETLGVQGSGFKELLLIQIETLWVSQKNPRSFLRSPTGLRFLDGVYLGAVSNIWILGGRVDYGILNW